MNTETNAPYGKNMFQPEVLQEVLDRIEKLTPQAQHVWGKMDVAQMLAHCQQFIKVPMGLLHTPRIFLVGWTIGPLLKFTYTDNSKFIKNQPTDPAFKIRGPHDFNAEKQRLIPLIVQFSQGGPEKCIGNPHSLFGNLTPAQWARGIYKHFDHHLRQFGV